MLNHPLFKPFNSTQTEEYLGSRPPGEVVIRPSSKGMDHLAITWKVADGIYSMSMSWSCRRTTTSRWAACCASERPQYTDLDELIVEHIQAMAKKVEEMMRHEKFQKGSRADLGKRLYVFSCLSACTRLLTLSRQQRSGLTTYMDANPDRSTYAFCIDTRKGEGRLLLPLLQVQPRVAVVAWDVRVIPKGYELLKNSYPDMRGAVQRLQAAVPLEMQKRQQGRNGR